MLASLFLCSLPSALQGADGRRAEPLVLFISSYHPGHPTFFDQIQGLRSVFGERGIRFDIEFMDTKRFESDVMEPIFLEALSRKLAVLPPYDLVVTADDAALQFALRNHASLLSNKPVVFFGVNEIDMGLEAAKNDHITGVLEEPAIQETVELFRRLQGDEAELLVITDASRTGLVMTALFVQTMQRMQFSNYRFLSLQEHPVADLIEQASALRKPAGILILSAYREQSSKALRFEQFANHLRASTQVPLYHLWLPGVGQGVMGGWVLQDSPQAEIAAEMAARILAGAPVKPLPVVRNVGHEWVFDYNELQRFGYDIGDLPAGSRILNQPDSLYERYRAYIGLLLALVGALFVIVASLVLRIRIRQAFERRLVEINRNLETNIRLRTKALEQARQEAESLLRMRNVILDNSLVGIVLIRERRVEWVNTYAEILFGYSSAEAIGLQADFIYANRSDFDKLGQESMPVLLRGESYRAEYEFRRKNGSVLWGIINGKALNPANLSEGVLFIVMDISARKHAEDQLRDMNVRLEALATTDHLTGITNRCHVSQLVAEEVDRCERYRQMAAVILLDVDHFKTLNDRYGHDVGDRVLKDMAMLLGNTVRKVDTAALWGGEEFLVLCPATAPQDAARLAELLRLRIEMHDFQLPDPVMASFGVAGYLASQSPDALIKNADQALYEAKALRNCVRLFTPVGEQSHPQG